MCFSINKSVRPKDASCAGYFHGGESIGSLQPAVAIFCDRSNRKLDCKPDKNDNELGSQFKPLSQSAALRDREWPNWTRREAHANPLNLHRFASFFFPLCSLIVVSLMPLGDLGDTCSVSYAEFWGR